MQKLATMLCLMSISLSAQWPNYPTPGVPRTPDGKPSLSVPAPRAADGKPDLSGVWLVRNAGALFYLGGNFKPEDIKPWAAALYKQREENYRRDTDGIHCLPPGPKAGIGVGPFPMKIVQTPNLTVILYEYETLFRQIFTDGRALPDGPNPTWMGYSVGHWEGDTLVVTTAGYNDRSTVDLAGHPHTEALRVTERYRRVDVGHMDLDVTFDDPEAYNRPWTISTKFDLVPDGDLIEYVCENERDSAHLVGTNGQEFHVPAETLTQYVGSYKSPVLAPGIAGVASVKVSLTGGRLMVDAGAGNTPLFAHSESSFTMEGTEVDFVKDAKGAITEMVEHWNEGDRHFPRIK